MPRVQEVVLPVLRAELPGVEITSWIPDVDYRSFPFINIRRVSGLGDPARADQLDKPVIEMTAYTRDGLVATENLYLDARYIIWNMCDKQTLTAAGYVHSFFETFGPTVFDSPFDDSWRVQGLIQLGIRPLRQ